jgi:hypothetical protein
MVSAGGQWQNNERQQGGHNDDKPARSICMLHGKLLLSLANGCSIVDASNRIDG